MIGPGWVFGKGILKAQIFYDKYGFEKFAEHDFPVGDGKVDRDWLLKLKL